MKKSTLVTGLVLVALGAALLAGVVLNVALTNFEGPWNVCNQRTSMPPEVSMQGKTEVPITTTYSLLPLRLNCIYNVSPPGRSATVSLDLGAVSAGFGISLVIIGGIVLIDGATSSATRTKKES
ncbi:hypothetical protein [Salinibacterium sp. SWN248]|uniref:hypothetical protein n=1 Tax=Salinibacterium sp. SWN248 TaxID=2792056 RepID=UPI0018CFA3E0|nr:hypothetical protein [Salinibacterium sp. SWN248]MBH0022531.1 hypothetical protein [Salinibacterium sp. SWN248]